MANKSLIVNDSDMTLDQKVTALLMCVAQEQKSEIDKLLSSRGLSFLQLNLLHVLSKVPEKTLTVNELKASMVDENPNVSRTLNKMVDVGLVTKRRSEQDQRTVYISITPEGERVHVEADQELIHMGSGLNKKDQQALYELLRKL